MANRKLVKHAELWCEVNIHKFHIIKPAKHEKVTKPSIVIKFGKFCKLGKLGKLTKLTK